MSEPTTSAPRMAVEDAARALADIDLVTARVRQSRIYLLASSALIIWGPIIALGYALTQFLPRYAIYTWPLCHLVGISLTAALVVRERRGAGRRGSPHVLTALLITIGLFSLANALLIPAITSLTSKRATLDQGVTMGLSNSFVSLGRIFGPTLGGLVFDLHWGLPFITASAVMLIGFFVSLRTLRDTQSKEHKLRHV